MIIRFLNVKSLKSLSENIDAFLFSLYLECRRGAERKIWPYKNDIIKYQESSNAISSKNYPPNINFEILMSTADIRFHKIIFNSRQNIFNDACSSL